MSRIEQRGGTVREILAVVTDSGEASCYNSLGRPWDSIVINYGASAMFRHQVPLAASLVIPLQIFLLFITPRLVAASENTGNFDDI